MHGKKTPISVPGRGEKLILIFHMQILIFFESINYQIHLGACVCVCLNLPIRAEGCAGLASPSAGALGIVLE